MNPSLRNAVIILTGLSLAVLFSLWIGQGDWEIPLLFGLMGLFGLSWFIFLPSVRLDGLILSGLVFGYIAGQRVFAQISLAGNSMPLFVGEVGLAICGAFVLIRTAFTKERFLPQALLPRVIAAFVLLGTFRFGTDAWYAKGDMTLLKNVVRDFATVYYAMFFFFALIAFQHPGSRRFFQRMLPMAVVALMPIIVLFLLFPHLFMRSWGELGHMAPRFDLSGAFLGFGCLYFLLRRERATHGFGRWLVLTGLGLSCFALSVVGLARSAMVSFALGLVLVMIAGKWKVVRDIVIFAFFAAVLVITVEEMSGTRPEARFTTRAADKISSIFDVGGSGSRYASTTGEYSSTNNRFRTAWWGSVYRETMDQNPVFGLGFGYDLAARFLRTYDMPLGEDFSARSPHNIFMTIFGRMGIVGLLSFLAVVGTIVYEAVRTSWAVRRQKTAPEYLAFWSFVIMTIANASLGVVLEGPMAATVCWALLGLAWLREHERLSEAKPSTKAMPIRPLSAGKPPGPRRPALAPAGMERFVR